MSSVWVPFLASVTYGFPSVILYFLTSFIIIKYRKVFNSSFFNLFIFDGIMNVFTYTNGFFLMRLNKITCEDCLLAPFYKSVGDFVPLRFLLTMGVHMAFVQYSFTTLVSLNRLCVLINYNVMEPIWKKLSWILVVLIYFAPFLSTYVVLDIDVKFVYLEATGYYALSYSVIPVLSVYAVLIPFMVGSILLSVTANVAGIFIVRNLKTDVRNKAENNLLVIMSITCAVQFTGTVLAVFQTLFATAPLMKYIALVVPYVSDGLTLVQPWLLISVSNAMRHHIKLTFGFKSEAQGSTQIVRVRSVTN